MKAMPAALPRVMFLRGSERPSTFPGRRDSPWPSSGSRGASKPTCWRLELELILFVLGEKTRPSVTLTAWRRAARCSPGNPALGRACDYIRLGLRRMEHGRHVVFYRQAAGGIPVSRILRQRMLPERQSIGDEDNGS